MGSGMDHLSLEELKCIFAVEYCLDVLLARYAFRNVLIVEQSRF